MIPEQEDIGKVIRERLNSLEGSPSNRVWEHIIKELDRDEPEKKPFVLWLIMCFILVGGLGVFGAYTLIKPEKYNTTKISNIPSVLKNSNLNTPINRPAQLKNKTYSTDQNTSNNLEKNNRFVKRTSGSTRSKSTFNKAKNHGLTGTKENHNQKSPFIRKISDSIDDDLWFPKTNAKVIASNMSIQKNQNELLSIYTSTGKKLFPKKDPFTDTFNSAGLNTLPSSQNSEKNTANVPNWEKQFAALAAKINPENPKDRAIDPHISLEEGCIFYYEQEETSKLPLAKKEQEKKKTKQNKQPWMLTPVYNAFVYDYISHLSPLDEFLLKNNKTQKELNASYGLDIGYQLTPKTTMHLGLRKTHISLTTKNIDTTSAILSYTGIELPSSNTSTLFRDFITNSPTFDIKQQQEYLEIPLSFRTQFSSNKKLNYSLRYGMSFLWLQDHKLTAINTTDNRKFALGQIRNLPKVNYSFYLSPGINYDVNTNIRLHLEPQVQWYLNQYKNNTMNPYALGINFGITYRFKL